jgi:hypothetical protein
MKKNVERLPVSKAQRERALVAKMFHGVNLNEVAEMRTRKTLQLLLDAYFDNDCDLEPDDPDFEDWD